MKRPRRERGGHKTRAQKERRRATLAGERVAAEDFPLTPNYGAQLDSNPKAVAAPSASARSSWEPDPVEEGEVKSSVEPESARSSAGEAAVGLTIDLTTEVTQQRLQPNSSLPSGPADGPRPSSSSSRGTASGSRALLLSRLSRSRILILSDFNGVINCDQFLRKTSEGREEAGQKVTLKNKQAVLRLLTHAPEIQLGILSYIGRWSTKKRLGCIEAIKELNQYLLDRNCSKTVGLRITDSPDEKSGIVCRVKAHSFVDDRYSTVQQTVNEVWDKKLQSEIFFLSEFPPRNRYLRHCRSFEEFVSQVLAARFVPTVDDPVWTTEFPPPAAESA